jgi:sulfatase modifying factor 1
VADIFISYAREDRAHADRIAGALEAEGWSVWWDLTIPAGKTFDRVIEEAIEAARCIVVLWSTTSVGSEWVREEADEGKRRGILIPIQIEHAVQVPFGFRRIQTASLVGWSGATTEVSFQRLVRDIAATVGSGPGTDAQRPTRTNLARPAAEVVRTPDP